ncbi:PTS sugar transporter subunit IIA [Aeromonas veronii]|uniref:PTS galactosamine/N-acetylgalactosamine transporter subunit IIA n=1 Tax=Aeromonas veronii TaxID=654 RepID=UPI001F397250|nr:PTS galactosamine/N-acetylgalactosamine transporter subunit IIA [Aeromonas veronii]ELI6423392.1 PTS sugar transporter subunit IIA [Aeromonas veronii]MCF5865282.1 PTS sugar transporter subunit IIA [Aeromonas veronii]
MLGIIICGHGGFASGLERAMLQILGEQEAVIAIDFPESSTTALLQAQCEAALAEVDKGDGVVFLTDLLGGTPFRVASTLSLHQTEREVITGTNLQLLLEMALERDGLSAREFRRQALDCGHRGLTSLADEMSKEHQADTALVEEGI